MRENGKFSPSVERFRGITQSLISHYNYPFPVELALAVITRESAGRIGAVNPHSGASGLMQIMPATLRDYNASTGRHVSLDQLRSTAVTSAPVQIEVGLWVMSRFWKGAYTYLERRLPTVEIADLVKTADLFYSAGPGTTKKRLNLLKYPSWQNISERFDDWKPVDIARAVETMANDHGAKWDLSQIRAWLGNQRSREKSPIEGFLLGGALIVISWQMMKKATKLTASKKSANRKS